MGNFPLNLRQVPGLISSLAPLQAPCFILAIAYKQDSQHSSETTQIISLILMVSFRYPK